MSNRIINEILEINRTELLTSISKQEISLAEYKFRIHNDEIKERKIEIAVTILIINL